MSETDDKTSEENMNFFDYLLKDYQEIFPAKLEDGKREEIVVIIPEGEEDE